MPLNSFPEPRPGPTGRRPVALRRQANPRCRIGRHRWHGEVPTGEGPARWELPGWSRAIWPGARGMLLAVFTGHDAPLAIVLIIGALMIGSAVTIVLVCLAKQDDRVAAIRACAEVLRALLPWSGRHGLPAQSHPLNRRRRPQ
jgi:hypothetical protein